MLQNKKVDPTRDLVTCPFNSAHVIVASRLGNHLIKCQKNYPDMDKAKCKFNSDHIVPKHELEHHEAHCTYRRNWEHFTHRVGVSTCPVTNAVPIHVEVPDSIEDWDNVPVVQNVSPLDVIQQKIVDKPVMRPLAKNGLTKSERKQFTLAEQRRLERLQQEKALEEERVKALGEKKDKKDKKAKSDLDSNTPLRLPKTSKLLDNNAANQNTPKLLDNTAANQNTPNAREKEVEQISQRLAEQYVTETEARYGMNTYYPDYYVGGYSLPPSTQKERQSCSFERRERESYTYDNECPESATYAGRGYDVDYYGGYTGGYGGNYEDAEEEERGKPNFMPRWYREGESERPGRGENMLREVRSPGLNAVPSQKLEKQRNPAQARLLRLKEAHEADSLKKNAAFSGTLEKENLENRQQATSERSVKSSSSCSSTSSSVPAREYMAEIDDQGFLDLLVSKGRGRGRGSITG